ncbi:hypothetical protein RGU39_21095 [Bacillus wiedmannii]|uniref:hypothetical protein n=1 Tax=Bacillus wiedmannii TaxID=1890302 RepID=UPI0028530B6A|nr:hypothetical protein [Bacillus wiedmannii]MDR4943059.1 hypothetical protein [Bacillus wiedmannii]
MNKLINTTDSDQIYKTLSLILEIRKEYLEHYIFKNCFYLANLDVNEMDINHLFQYLSKSNLDYNNDIQFDSVAVSHLTARNNGHDIENQPLYNLFDALTKESDLSQSFSKLNIKFQRNENTINTYYRGKLIDWSDYNEVNAYRVNVRLGKTQSTDRCICGFLFNDKIFENSNISSFREIPEVALDILTLFKEQAAIDAWKQQTKTYIVTFKVPITQVNFNQQFSDVKDKQLFIIKQCIQYLCKNKLNQWESYHNPMVFLNEDINVNSNNILNVYKVK